ncbi:MAG TPA: DUF1631 family protein [Solimonas sp.]|nr:DUF1631 family protein [Solimonas sp.]
MSASLHSRQNAAGQPATSGFRTETATELLRELRGLVMRGLGDRLSRMFSGADDLLFDMSEKAHNNDQQRVYFDTMRALRLGRAQIAEQYETCIRESFDSRSAAHGDGDPGEVDMDSLTLLDSTELEESLAISNMANRADTVCRNALFELERRFEWLSRNSPVTVPVQAIAPLGFCNAFRTSIKLLDTDFSIKLVLYKLYERLVLGDLMPLYAEILILMDRTGVQGEKKAPPARPAGAAPLPAGPMPAAAMPAGPAAMPSPMAGFNAAPPMGPLPTLDEQTMGLLQQFGNFQPGGMPGMGGMGGMPGAGGANGATGYYGMPSMPGGAMQGGGAYQGAGLGNAYADAMLASELMAAARGQSVQGLDPGHAWAMTQRAGLVGRMFNEIVTDQNLPRGVTGALEDLRFPVIKTALSDGSFFSDAQHPVRSLINDLASMAASTRAGGPAAVARFEELVGRVKQQFDLNAESVRPKARAAAPLEEGDIERFLDQQIAQGRERRQTIVEKVKKVVAQELELSTLTHQPLPETAEPLLRSGWGPMMAMRLLRNGHDSEVWRAGMELLHRVLFALNPKSPNARSPAEREALRRDLAVALAEVGMPADRIDGLLDGLGHALDDVHQEVKAAKEAKAAEVAAMAQPSAAVAELLAKLPSVPVEDETPEPREPEPVETPAASRERLFDKLLHVGSWFRVYDRSNQDTRWLKITSWHPQAQRVSFAEFDGKNALTLHTNDLFEDLMQGRSEPIDSEPATLQLLKILRDAHPPAETA